MEVGISRTESMVEEMDTSVKENGKSKKPSDTNHPGNLAYYEETKPEYNNRRILAQKPRKYF